MAKKTDYSKKLSNPLWQKKRLELMNLRGFKCEMCGCEEKELHIHHRFYIKGRQVWEYDNDVFQVLCYECHDKIHKQEKEGKTTEKIVEKIVEVVPTKYEGIIAMLDEICYESYLQDQIKMIIWEFMSDINFMSNLSDAINSSDYLTVLKINLQHESSRIQDEISTERRFSVIEKYLQRLKLPKEYLEEEKVNESKNLF